MSLDPTVLSDALDAFSSPDQARRTTQHTRSIRGIRGVSSGEIARIAAATWWEDKPTLPRDEDALDTLFGTAYEDGLVAIAILGGITPDRPGDALDVARSWLDRVDDVHTADALGWVVLGPAWLTLGAPWPAAATFKEAHPIARRAAVMAGMALTPTPIEGPGAACLRERLGTPAVRFVDAPLSDVLAAHADGWLRDPDPGVRKGLRRVLGAWARFDPDAAEAWVEAVLGGVPKMLKDEVRKAARRGRREGSP